MVLPEEREDLQHPWELVPGNIGSLKLKGKHGSLSEGCWVEDSVLEDALKAIVKTNEGRLTAVVLESYIINLSMRKDYGPDNPIIRYGLYNESNTLIA